MSAASAVASRARRLRYLSRMDIAQRAWVGLLGASPLDKPNTVLMLSPYSSVRLTQLGVDRPERMCAALRIDA